MSGNFLDCEIPKNLRYLSNYFKSDLQQSFLKYYLTFGNWKCFKAHTGIHCSPRSLESLEIKYKFLTEIYNNAKSDMTEENMKLVYLMETGKIRMDKLGKMFK